ncbi:MAG TPA: DUF5916 domain-containing protein [Gemmatimonadaceae bacterium]|nr:DUF5916 domain-containing protein [Gemmatimonadaceae bacterium]
MMRDILLISLPLAAAPLAAQQLASAAVPTAAAAALPPSSASRANAVRAITPPVIDGREGDPIWERAQVIQGFRMFEPVEDGPERFHSVARVAYDEKYLYVLVRAFDPHPDSIVALLSRRDVRTPSDQIKVMIDSYHDRRTGYEFAVNPIGVKRDYYTFNDGEEDESWDGVWDVATRVDSLGWVAEFRIPFNQLRFPERETHTFGIMLTREIARTNERMSWPVYRRSRAGIASQFGDVGGITGIGKPRRLEITPYVVATNATRASADVAGEVTGYGRSQRLTGGADIKYGVSSNLTLDATVNPDFGQVEADPAVLNLGAFETFFDERRPFFIEGTGIFRFDVNCNDGRCNGLFYSRRIGRSPQLSDLDGWSDASTPTATTILSAAKLTGRLSNGLSVGVLDALTARESGVGGRTVEPRTNYFVARLQQDLRNGRSGVGVMFTAVDRSLDQWSADYLRRAAYAGGVDFRHRFLGERYELTGFLAGTRVAGSAKAIAATQESSVHYYQRPDDGVRFDSTRTSLGGDAEQIGLSKIGGGIVRGSTSFTRFSPGFEINDVGFLSQAGRQSWSNWVQLQFNTPRGFYRSLRVNFNEWQSWTTQGFRAAHRTTFGGNVNAHAEFKNSWWGHIGVGVDNAGAVYCDFCARGGPAVRLSPALFAWAGIEGDTRRALAPQLWVNYNHGDAGRSRMIEVNPLLTYRASSRFDVTLGPDLTRETSDAQYLDQLEDPGAGITHFTFARLDRTTLGVTSRANFTFSPNLSLQLYAQPYVSTGHYSDWRELDEPRSASYDRRYRSFTPADTSLRLSSYDFNAKQFHSTTVLRWEYRRGSTLFFVWTQGREQDDRNPGSFGFRRDYGDLFRSHPDNTFLIKASYWFSP